MPVRKRRLYIVVCLVLLVLITVGTIWLISWASKPVTQTIATPETTPETTTKPETKTLPSKYFRTTIPADYDVKQTPPKGDESIIGINAFEPQSNGARIAVTTAPLPLGGVPEVADYKYRATYSTVYSKTNMAQFPDAPMFAKNADNETELTVFLTHNGRYATVSITSYGVRNPSTAKLMGTVLDAWQWK